MLVTVAICTWNRAELLDATLEHMTKMEIPSGIEWELLVVNNRCTDNTDEIIEKHKAHLPVKRLFESVAGVASARNCAAQAAQGELILWTDDDVLVDSQWMVNYVAAANQFPEATLFGGPIEPWFEVAPSKWIEANMQYLSGVYALLEKTSEPSPLSLCELPYGANFAIRTEVQKKHLYNPKLGRLEDQLLCGEETDLYERVLKEGHLGYWVPDVRVKHFIHKGRLTKKYVQDWYHAFGVSNFQMGNIDGVSIEAGVDEAKLRKKRKKAKMKCFLRQYIFRSKKWVKSFCRAAYYEGVLEEYHKQKSSNPEIGNSLKKAA